MKKLSWLVSKIFPDIFSDMIYRGLLSVLHKFYFTCQPLFFFKLYIIEIIILIGLDLDRGH